MPPASTADLQRLEHLNHEMESQSPQEVLRSALTAYFPDIVLASSFGAEDVVLIDMVHQLNPLTPILYLDTDFLFPETYATRDALVKKYRIAPIQVKSLLTPEQQSGSSRALSSATSCGNGSRTSAVSSEKSPPWRGR